MFPRHEILFAEGKVVESFFPGDMAMSTLCQKDRDTVKAPKSFETLSRPALTRRERLKHIQSV